MGQFEEESYASLCEVMYCINDDDDNDWGSLEPAGAGVGELCCAAVSPSDGVSSLKILYRSVLTALTGLLGVTIRLL